ncbi:unnamed protein product (macronuclear) [Paramecium tetraurelia]|uniref:Uncharacterized protein n=1 Tax=Paramecium tetraurelia TaxID=5888 RepID=A0DMK9_PARTE|nr:uncharacterized protein GSPATT00018494001 [Paramecium tetraurelia]CAK84276.1 unnamed protein product [Paramecium tetraurelia]|eukprot:XP_001451673.1 hypothetical protein (macronuclear) [Paramecium tetraurelia strain d4-2]
MSTQQELPIYIQQTPQSPSQISQVQYPILSNTVPADQYIQLDDGKQTGSEKTVVNDVNLDRQAFLVEYYIKISVQHSIILGLFLFGLNEWFSSIVVHHGQWWSSFRWTWYVVLSLLIAIVIGLPLLRKYRFIVQLQSTLYQIQTILIAFLLIGIAGNQRGNEYHKAVNVWTILVLLILIGHDLLQIVIVKFQKTHYYTVIMKFTIIGSLGLNFILALLNTQFNTAFIICGIIIYAFYYFNQLNNQLLKQTHELPEELSIFERIRKLSFTRHILNQEARQNQVIEELQVTHFVINKHLAIVVGSGVGYIIVLVLSIVTGNVFLIFTLILGSISMLSVILETQVASRSLLPEDSHYAVCLTYLDMASPLRLLLRSLFNK